tara:strand:+ start:977 stop:1678 length:702 start_codon:yes stop_codon:yes gene_type:complete
MALNPTPSTSVTAGKHASLSNTVSTASGGNLAEVTRFTQDLTCEYSSVTIIDNSWPQLVTDYTGGIKAGSTAYKLNLNYNISQTRETIPVLNVGAGVEVRIPLELSGASYDNTTGLGTGGIITTQQQGIKQRHSVTGDVEFNISRFFNDIILVPDPSFARTALQDQETIATWFKYRIVPQLITNGGNIESLGMGAINDISSYGFKAYWSPTGNVWHKEPVPPCPQFKFQLMAF